LATLCKEPALTLPCIIVAYDVALNFSKKKKILSLYSLARYSLYFAIAGVYLIIRFYALGSFVPEKKDLQFTLFEYILNIFSLFSQCLGKLILPIQLNFYHIFHPISSPLTLKAIIALLTVLVFIWVMIREFKKSWVVFIGMLFIIIPLIPTFYIPALAHGLKNAFAERYLYLPSFGFALLSALLFTWVQFKKQNQAKAFSVIVVSLICLYSIGTISRNDVWKDNYSIWLDTVRKSPDGDVPHGSLGYALIEKGRIDEAIPELQIALSLNPEFAEAHNNLGIAYRDKGLFGEALEEFSAAFWLNPADPLFSRNLKETYEMQRLFNEAKTRNRITN
jgi:tetratricopeptide (TPR) repeat protein